MGDSESDTESDNSDDGKNSNSGKKSHKRGRIINSFKKSDVEEGTEDGETLKDNADEKDSGAASTREGDKEHRDVKTKDRNQSILKASAEGSAAATDEGRRSKRTSFQLQIPIVATGMMTSMSTLEQSMPADAVLAKEGAEEVSSQIFCHVSYLWAFSFYKALIQPLCHLELSLWKTFLKV